MADKQPEYLSENFISGLQNRISDLEKELADKKTSNSLAIKDVDERLKSLENKTCGHQNHLKVIDNQLSNKLQGEGGTGVTACRLATLTEKFDKLIEELAEAHEEDDARINLAMAHILTLEDTVTKLVAQDAARTALKELARVCEGPPPLRPHVQGGGSTEPRLESPYVVVKKEQEAKIDNLRRIADEFDAIVTTLENAE